MKAYNKKTFAFGVFSTALGVLNAVTAALRGADAGDIVLIACLLFFGIGAMLRGTSKRLAREDRLEELDERNRLVKLKYKARSGDIMFWITTAVMILALLAYHFTRNLGWGFIFVTSGVLAGISILVELIVFIYYEHRS